MVNESRRKMPSRQKIAEYWFQHFKQKYDRDIDPNTCFACARDIPASVERCHIKPRWRGGDDSVGNLHLLCKMCHYESEGFFGNDWHYWHWLAAVIEGRFTTASEVMDQNRTRVYCETIGQDFERSKAMVDEYLQKDGELTI
jgi:hypothetical protein